MVFDPLCVARASGCEHLGTLLLPTSRMLASLDDLRPKLPSLDLFELRAEGTNRILSLAPFQG